MFFWFVFFFFSFYSGISVVCLTPKISKCHTVSNSPHLQVSICLIRNVFASYVDSLINKELSC